MSPRGPWRSRVVAIGACAVAIGGAVAGGVIAAGDPDPLTPTRKPADQNIEKRVDRLLGRMTLQEKLEQIQLLADNQVDATPTRRRASAASSASPTRRRSTSSSTSRSSSRGCTSRSCSPSTRSTASRRSSRSRSAQASSFDPDVAADRRHDRRARVHRVRDQADLQPDGRRLARAAVGPDRRGRGRGPVPRLGHGRDARARRPGRDYSAPDKVITSPKHLAAYGQPEGGREYNTTDMSEQRLRNMYLPPFKAAVDAGADTSMCSFNAINGVPGLREPETETEILKHEWGFDGFIESDYTAVAELRACPPVNPDDRPVRPRLRGRRPGRRAPGAERRHGLRDGARRTSSTSARSCVRTGQVSIKRIDDAVRRILRVKFRAGLFEHPFVDESQVPAKTMQPADVAAARSVAGRSMVLLKNEGGDAPAERRRQVGRRRRPARQQPGRPARPVVGQGRPGGGRAVLDGIKAAVPDANVTFTAGCDIDCADDSRGSAASGERRERGRRRRSSALGESAAMSGEASSRAESRCRAARRTSSRRSRRPASRSPSC